MVRVGSTSIARLQDIFDQAPFPTLVIQQDRVVYSNPSAHLLLGGSADEIDDRAISDFIHPESREALLTRIAELDSGRPGFSGHRTTIVHLDGSHRIAALDAWRISLESGPAVQMSLREVKSDSLDEKTNDHALTESERHTAELRSILASISDGVYVGDMNGIYLCNRPALEMLGFENEEQLIAQVGDLARLIQTRVPETGEPIGVDDQPFVRALRGEQCVKEVLTRNIKTGHDVLVRSAAAPVYLDGKIIGAIAVNTDITDMRRNERMLRENEAIVAVGQLAWQVAHEINNPLQAAMNLLALAATGRVSEIDRQHYLKMTQEQLRRAAEVLVRLLATKASSPDPNNAASPRP